MLNDATVPTDLPAVIDYADARVATAMASGRMNTEEAALCAHIASAIRRGHPQMRTWPVRGDRICLVGSGPSLPGQLDTLRRLVWEGATLVTLNGAYHWCIDHGLRPNTQIVMDARPSNARFVSPEVPHCRYVLASQCAPETWDAVAGRPEVWIWHPVIKAEGPASALLDAYYGGHWIGVGGGTTVATRALSLLRIAGYVRYDLFGIDCCWIEGVHHAVSQPENAQDQWCRVMVGARDRPETMRAFQVSPWHLKQFEDFVTVLRLNGQHFQLQVHGDGLLAYILRTLGAQDEAVLETVDNDNREGV